MGQRDVTLMSMSVLEAPSCQEAVVDSGLPRTTIGCPSTTTKERAMNYLCLVYSEEKKLDDMSKSESDALIDEHLAYDEVLRKSGYFIVAEALQPVQAATTVRVRNGKVSITDGPFAETKEQLAGFFLINARDLNDAIQVASKIPSARLGSVEVRPIMELKQQ
jgi:hypothetical protein